MIQPQPGAATFPRRQAVTRHFSLGLPRSFTPTPQRVLFLRSLGPEDPVLCLWALERDSGLERLLVDPREVDPDGDGALPPEERARRERVREHGGGIVAYAADAAGTVVAFTLGGRLLVADATTGTTVQPAVEGPIVDPRPDPTGSRIAFVRDGGLWVDPGPAGTTRRLLHDDDPDVTWGLAEFVAAEEMDRTRGYWWSPDGQRLVAARVDVSPVATWWIASPVDPHVAPVATRYPAAGTANAHVSLAVVDLDGATTPITWDREALPYLVDVSWEAGCPLALQVLSRDQRRAAVLTADPDTGTTREIWADEDPVWVEPSPGSPAFLPGTGALAEGARMVHVVVADDRRRVAVDGRIVSSAALHVRALLGLEGEAAIVHASAEDPIADAVWRIPLDGGEPEALTDLDGIADGMAQAGTVVTIERSLRSDNPVVTVHGVGRVAASPAALGLDVRVEHAVIHGVRTALVLPLAWTPEDGPLPVLVDPYGGPHGQRVAKSRRAYAEPQWFAEQGYAVVVADGRGTPGIGLRWEQAVHRDLAGPVLDDQVAALEGAAARWPGALDLERVAIRGWSFGGYVAGLAVLDRPDRFHAAIVGAPVTDWRLYDTHYTERYLGDPSVDPGPYERGSLIARAPALVRPMLLIHGLADDNVVAAHTLRLSRALLEAGRVHRVLPLSGVTHMTPQEAVAENLLHLQCDFLAQALAPLGS